MPQSTRRSLFRLVPVAFTALVAAAGAFAAPGDEDLERLRNRIEQIGSELQDSGARRDALTAELRESEERIGRLTRHLNNSEKVVADFKQRLSELQTRIKRANKRVIEARAALEAHLRSAYLLGRHEQLRLLLKEDDPAMVSRLIVYYDYITRSRSRQVTELQQAIHNMQEEEQASVAAEQRLRESLAIAAGEKDRLEKAQRVREELIAALNRELSGKDVQLKRLKEDRAYLEKVLAGLLAGPITPLPETADVAAGQGSSSPAPASKEPFVKRKGDIPWPAGGARSARFGERRASGVAWDGVLIAAPEGGLVRAVHAGRVVYADWLRGFGLLLILDHGDGYMTLYGYNQSLFKEVGEMVSEGDAVGVVGRSGGQEEAGVYFGIRYNGRAVDPEKWCGPPLKAG